MRATLVVFLVVFVGASGPASAVEPFADLRVRSSENETTIQFELPAEIEETDQTRTRRGRVAVEAIELFFPNLSVGRARLVSVGDSTVEEARFYDEASGVVVRVVLRRPATYELTRIGDRAFLRVRPGTLRARVPSGDVAARDAKKPERIVDVDTFEENEGLGVDAERLTYDEETAEIVAEGRVTIARGESLLTAERVRINPETKAAEAVGNVLLSDTQGSVRAKRFSLNLDDETGLLEDATIYLRETNMTVSGDRLEKSYGQTYHIENGVFTTCNCGAGAPTWSLAGRDVDITLEGYGIARDATFRLFDVPILYFPVAIFPAKNSRQSGLLAPQVGFSEKRGFEYLQPIYFVPNKSSDATVAFNIETEARIGGIAEYRYALSPKSDGVWNVSYFNESIRQDAEGDIVNQDVADPEIPENRWSVTASGGQELPLGLQGFADVLAVSDDFYLREIPTFSFDPLHDRLRRSSRFTVSRGGVYKFWERTTLISQVQVFQDFIEEDDLTFQRLPQVNLFSSERFFDRHLKLEMSGEAVNFSRKEGFDGQRVDLAPELGVPFRLKEYLRGWAYLGGRETAYHLDSADLILDPVLQCPPGTDPIGEAPNLTCVDPMDPMGPPIDPVLVTLPPAFLPETSPTRELFFANLQAGTELFRVFEVDGESVLKVKHTIEPAVDYLFIPDVDQEDLPQYDFVDRIKERNLVTYGVTSRLLAKVRGDHSRWRDRLGLDRLNSFTGVADAAFGEEIDSFDPYGEGDESAAPVSPDAPAEDAALETEGASIVEWGRVAVFQSYSLGESLRPERDESFSNVDFALSLSPVRFFALGFDSSFDATESRVDAANVGLRFSDPRPRVPGAFLQSGPPASIGLSYRFLTDDVLEEFFGTILVPLADTLSTFYQGRFDAIGSEFLENRVGFRFSSQCRCWIFDIFATDRVNPDETEVRAQLTLVGLGSIGRDPLRDQRPRRY